MMRKALGLGSRGAPKKWSTIRPKADLILQACSAHYQVGIDEVMTSPDRWSEALCDDVVPTDKSFRQALDRMFTAKATSVTTSKERVWATVFNKILNSCWPAPDVRKGFSFNMTPVICDLPLGSTIYMCGEKNYSCLSCFELVVGPPASGFESELFRTLYPVRPLARHNSYDLLAQHYDVCHGERYTSVWIFQHSIVWQRGEGDRGFFAVVMVTKSIEIGEMHKVEVSIEPKKKRPRTEHAASSSSSNTRGVMRTFPYSLVLFVLACCRPPGR